ncbi:MAG: T9SS type A sorting domain-containing protein, partial [Ignavibacteriales bacterium]|nr:T9SS type A sorting domain-containing protein [Ignavibacteriales bacterium]
AAEQSFMGTLSSSLNARYGYTGIKMNLGVVKSDKGTQSGAFTFYSSAETDISGSASSSSLAPQIYYNQAWEYYKSKSFTQAMAAVNKTISHQSANSYLKAKAYVLRGSIYYGNNDIANTKKDMESAKTLDLGGPIGRMADENLSAINATGVERDKDKEVPTEYALLTNYPNPFNPSTTIRFQLPARSNVRVLVYDITGREIRTLVNDNVDAGSYSVRWEGEDNAGRTVTSGVYIVRMNAGYYTKTQKVVLLR